MKKTKTNEIGAYHSGATWVKIGVNGPLSAFNWQFHALPSIQVSGKGLSAYSKIGGHHMMEDNEWEVG